MPSAGNDPVGGIFSDSCKVVKIHLYGAFLAIHSRHRKYPCRGHFQLLIQSTGKAPAGDVFSHTYMALEMPL
jgi:hypothetical protein